MSDFTFNKLSGPMALLVAFYGMSGSGKTYSAIAWAIGAARAVPGSFVAVIDTESGRAMHYHKDNGGPFEFHHLSLDPPYSTERYQAAIDFCIEEGAGAIVVDSYSHEHEGIGGVLEQHGEELHRLTRGDAAKAQDMNGMAWMVPKRARKAQFNRLLQKRIPVAFCFRAKAGTDWNFRDDKGRRKPRSIGIVPIGDWDTIYEMTCAMLFRSGSDGVPDWHPDPRTESMTATLAKKCPAQFRQLLDYAGKGVQINATVGESMARWARGEKATDARFDNLSRLIELSTNERELREAGAAIAASGIANGKLTTLRALYVEKQAALAPIS